jgi:hypothetical protein
MARMNKLDRRGSGPFFYLAIVVLVFSLYEGAIAWSTVDKCDGYASKTWQVLPPKWECHNPIGFG